MRCSLLQMSSKIKQWKDASTETREFLYNENVKIETRHNEFRKDHITQDSNQKKIECSQICDIVKRHPNPNV